MSAVTMQLTVIADGNNIAYAVWAHMLTNARKKIKSECLWRRKMHNHGPVADKKDTLGIFQLEICSWLFLMIVFEATDPEKRLISCISKLLVWWLCLYLKSLFKCVMLALISLRASRLHLIISVISESISNEKVCVCGVSGLDVILLVHSRFLCKSSKHARVRNSQIK